MSAIASLLDTNVWLALAVEFHPHHAEARRRWGEVSAGGIACNRVTHMGFLRLLTNSKVMGPHVRTNRQAWAEVAEAFQLSGASDHAEPAHLPAQWEKLAAGQPATRDSWTDSYLAAFAICSGFRLVTFDQGFKRYKGLDSLIL